MEGVVCSIYKSKEIDPNLDGSDTSELTLYGSLD